MNKKRTTISIRNGYTKQIVLEVDDDGIDLMAPLDGKPGFALGNWWLTKANARKLANALLDAVEGTTDAGN